MTITNGYATLADFKNYAAISSTNATDDAVIEQLIEQASRTIDRLTARRFWVDTNDVTRYFTADAEEQRVTVGDLVSITSLACDDGSRAYGTTFAATDYDLWPYDAAQKAEAEPYQEIRLAPTSTAYFEGYAKGVKVVGKFGWPAVPHSIREACYIIALNDYKRRFGEGTNSATVTAAGIVLTPDGIPQAAWLKISPYVRRR